MNTTQITAPSLAAIAHAAAHAKSPCPEYLWCAGHHPDHLADLETERFHWGELHDLCALTANDVGRNEKPPAVRVQQEADSDQPGGRASVQINLDASYDREGLRRLAAELVSAADALVQYGATMDRAE
ncbi:hypothetical protein IWX78_001329 [Mycetocola sp. CAN_C7]|uniref:DUF6907 domain-containing protein n=1 Tax=Mycetocola sp. CAN_C7 TaxID=2787724 RepID=UPI0018C9F516